MARGPITPLAAADLARLVELLDASGLPSDDCDAPAPRFHGIFDGERLIAAGGLEPAGRDALLRSLAVRAGRRGEGLGAELLRFLVARARADGHAALWLLTEGADAYFARHGFRRVARDAAPAAIARTRQFAALCPADAVCMTLPLSPG